MTNQIQKAERMPAAAASSSTAMMEIISRAASDATVDIDKLERLLQMKERMDAKDSMLEFNSCLAKMQIAIPSIAERGVGHNIRYATLEDILDVVRPIMHEYGFAIVFKMATGEKVITITGVLLHASGHSIDTALTLPFDTSGNKNAVQAAGSTISYGKRYVLNALLNLTTRAEDDNGFAAVPVAAVTDIQAMSINGLLEKCSDETQAKFAAAYGEVSAISKADFNKVMSGLRTAVARDAGVTNANN